MTLLLIQITKKEKYAKNTQAIGVWFELARTTKYYSKDGCCQESNLLFKGLKTYIIISLRSVYSIPS